MKKFYKLDSKLYFILIVFFKETLKDCADQKLLLEQIHTVSVATARKIGYKKFTAASLDYKKIDTLSRTVGSAIFSKKSGKYFANTNDVFQLLSSYKVLNKTALTIKICLDKNLKDNGNEEFSVLFDNYFNQETFNTKLLYKEKKNLSWFLLHSLKKETQK